MEDRALLKMLIGDGSLAPVIMRAALGALLVFCAAPGAAAQEANAAADSLSGPDDLVRVYLDCSSFETLIKENITYVNYVNDRLEAQLHIICASQSAAAGQKYIFIFLGKEEFEGINDTLAYSRSSDEAVEKTQQEVIRVLQLGLVRYVARTAVAEHLRVSCALPSRGVEPVDPWDHWIFYLYASTYATAQKKTDYHNYSGSVSIDRVTEDLKLSLDGSFSYSESRYELERGSITNIARSNEGDCYAVMRLSDRWSGGLAATVLSNIRSNYDLYASVGPAIEYNFYPYSEYATKYVTVRYVLQYIHADYDQITIFNKTSEDLGRHLLALSANVKRPWGSVVASVTASHYLHDIEKNRLSFDIDMSVQLFKGFSIDVGSSYSAIHDQLALLRGRMSDEDVLLSRHELATNYSYSTSLGFSYRFGSKYCNIVNPRLNSL